MTSSEFTNWIQFFRDELEDVAKLDFYFAQNNYLLTALASSEEDMKNVKIGDFYLKLNRPNVIQDIENEKERLESLAKSKAAWLAMAGISKSN